MNSTIYATTAPQPGICSIDYRIDILTSDVVTNKTHQRITEMTRIRHQIRHPIA
jgi:hypothetical protein